MTIPGYNIEELKEIVDELAQGKTIGPLRKSQKDNSEDSEFILTDSDTDGAICLLLQSYSILSFLILSLLFFSERFPHALNPFPLSFKSFFSLCYFSFLFNSFRFRFLSHRWHHFPFPSIIVFSFFSFLSFSCHTDGTISP